LQIPPRRYLDIPAKYLNISRRRYLIQNGPLPWWDHAAQT